MNSVGSFHLYNNILGVIGIVQDYLQIAWVQFLKAVFFDHYLCQLSQSQHDKQSIH